MIEFYREGSPWWVSANLSADADIVIPRPSNRGAPTAGTGVRNMESYRLIILGYHYDFTGTNNDGFDLEWTDTTTPGSAQRTILQVRLQGSNNVGSPEGGVALRGEGGSAFCFIPGPGGQTTPVENGATLRLNVTATAPASGRLLIWGIQVPDDWKPGKSFTGSPVSF